MKINQWTLGLAAAGVVSLASAVQAEEAANQLMTAVSATTLSGYVDTSIIWRPGTQSSGGAFTGVGAHTAGPGKQDGFNLNLVKLRLEKALDESEWSAGYRAELMFGPDAHAYNNGFSPIGAGQVGNSDFGIKDAYVQLRAPVGNGLTFKIGSFSTPLGFESFDSPDNANFTRSYAWQAEPTQHTGILTSYKVNEALSLSAGVANTHAAGINGRTLKNGGSSDESRKTYIAGITLTAPESWGTFKGATLTGGFSKGFSAGAAGSLGTSNAGLGVTGISDVYNYYVGITTPTGLEGLTAGISYDYAGTQKNAAYASDSTYFNAIGIYSSYQASEKLKFNIRGEYATSTSGIIDNMTTGGIGGASFANLNNSHDAVMGLTVTVDYNLWANVMSRLELRWDHDLSQTSDGSLFETGAGAGAKNMTTVALNIIYKF